MYHEGVLVKLNYTSINLYKLTPGTELIVIFNRKTLIMALTVMFTDFTANSKRNALI